MEATKKYRPILKGGVLAACIGITVFLLSLKPDNFTLLAVVAGILGFCMIPLLPVVLENNAECVQVKCGTCCSHIHVALILCSTCVFLCL